MGEHDDDLESTVTEGAEIEEDRFPESADELEEETDETSQSEIKKPEEIPELDQDDAEI